MVRFAALAWLGHILAAGGITAAQSMLAIALLFCIAGWWRGELVTPWHRAAVPMALYVLASWGSALASPDPLDGLDQANEWFHFSAFLVGISLIRTVPVLRERSLACFAFIISALAVLGLWQYFVLGHTTLEQRITGTTAHVMTFSGLLLVGSLFLGVIAMHRRSLLYGSAFAITSLALALTFTRGAWLGWLVGAVVWLAIHRPRWIAWSLPVVLIALVLAPMPLFSRLASSFDTRQASNFDRLRMAESGIEMIRDQPLSGVGPGQLKPTYTLYRSEDAPRFRIPHLHNNPLQIWAERGLGALMAVVALFGVFLISFWRSRSNPLARQWAEGGLVVISGFLVAGMFEFNFGDTEVLMGLLDVLAIAVAGAEAARAQRVGEPVTAGTAIMDGPAMQNSSPA